MKGVIFVKPTKNAIWPGNQASVEFATRKGL
jgi:hypothetical protein